MSALGRRTSFRKPGSVTSIELDDLSESMTLASLETSSTAASYTRSVVDDRDSCIPRPSPSLQEDATFSRLMRIILIAEDPGALQNALAALFSYVCDGRMDSVIRSLVQHEHFLDLLQKLANYEPAHSTSPNTPARPWHNAWTHEESKTWTLELRRTFLTRLLRHCWDRLTISDAWQICAIFKEEHSILRYLFPMTSQHRDGSTEHIDFILTYFARPTAEWPSLTAFEETLFRHVPEEWPISNIARILPCYATPELSCFVDHILKATRPNADLDPSPRAVAELEKALDEHSCDTCTTTSFLRRHPASPSLWLALYLAEGNDYAASALIAGGIVRNVRDLYDSDFPDPRASSEVASQSIYDLMRLCYMLLRVLFPRHKVGSRKRAQSFAANSCSSKTEELAMRNSGDKLTEHAWEREKALAESLQEDLREDLRHYARQMSADTVMERRLTERREAVY